MKQQRTTDRPQLPNIFTNSTKSTLTRASKSNQNKNSSTMGQNGSDAIMEVTNDAVDMSSPYSPGSSLSDGMFDPPSPGNYNSPSIQPVAIANNKNNASKPNKSTEKKDAFDALFAAGPPPKAVSKSRSKKPTEKKKKCAYDNANNVFLFFFFFIPN